LIGCPFELFLLPIVLSVLRVIFIANCTVCPSGYFYYQLYCLSFELFLLPIVLSVLRIILIVNCTVCPSNYFYCQLYCLSLGLFLLSIVLSVLRFICFAYFNAIGNTNIFEGQTVQLTIKIIRRTANTIGNKNNSKDRQYNWQ
jgi:hypothetical protein